MMQDERRGKKWRKDRKVAVRKGDDGEGTTDAGGRRKDGRNDSGWNEERLIWNLF